ncbi:MAG: Lrp/AsnC family transcriptional regulator [Luminiphilus sp.]|nr:Lrp/AsnC family transcriptional regulator [Pseudomonadales bacterium]MBL6901512.1 Lrp/AsnC family transcriptional regulator [Luminiphilus sp.]
MRKCRLDSIDKKILQALQTDCSGSVAEIAERAGVTQTPCWRRIKKLEEMGYIDKRVALLDQKALNLRLTAYVMVKTSQHDQQWLTKFSDGVHDIPEIVEIHRMAGDIDYLLKIVAEDMAEYDRIYKNLIRVAELSDVSASFSMECIKASTELPLTRIR